MGRPRVYVPPLADGELWVAQSPSDVRHRARRPYSDPDVGLVLCCTFERLDGLWFAFTDPVRITETCLTCRDAVYPTAPPPEAAGPLPPKHSYARRLSGVGRVHIATFWRATELYKLCCVERVRPDELLDPAYVVERDVCRSCRRILPRGARVDPLEGMRG